MFKSFIVTLGVLAVLGLGCGEKPAVDSHAGHAHAEGTSCGEKIVEAKTDDCATGCGGCTKVTAKKDTDACKDCKDKGTEKCTDCEKHDGHKAHDACKDCKDKGTEKCTDCEKHDGHKAHDACKDCKDKGTEKCTDCEKHDGHNDDKAALKAQTICPVMSGVIVKTIYADHDGKRVYFCCAGCIATFKANPAKYIKKLEDAGVKLDDAM